MTPTCKGLGRLLGGHSFKACYDEESVERKDADGAEYARTEKTVVGIWCRWCGQPAPSRSALSRPSLEAIGVHEGDAEPPRQRTAA
jgi:hypothetical protein